MRSVAIAREPGDEGVSIEACTRPAPTPVHSPSGKPTAVDLFCGCGGVTVGLKRAGFRVLGAVDIDQTATQTYRANHRAVRVWEEDVRLLRPAELLEQLGLAAGELDLLAGCPPCQGFSTMRTLNGAVRVADPRNALLGEFGRFVEGLQPRVVMMENVPGLSEHRGFKSFLRHMQGLGYRGDYCVLDAAEYAVPQRRRRLIYLAGRGFAVPFAPKAKRKVTVQDAICGLPPAGASGDPAHDVPESHSAWVMRIIRHIPKDGGSRKSLPASLQLPCHKRSRGFNDVYGRMAWSDVAPTITSGCFNPSRGRFLHPEEDRAITLREAALLQGFPRSYRFPTAANKTATALLIGNALPPPLIAAHARGIRRALQLANASESAE